MIGGYSTEEQVLRAHFEESRMVTAAAAVVAKMDNETWMTHRVSLNDRGGKNRLHYKADTAGRQYWREIGRGAVRRLAKQLDEADEVGAPYRVIVYYIHRHLADRDSINTSPVTKALVDGLVLGGLLPDDNNRWVTGQDSRLLRTEGYQVEVMVHILGTPTKKESK